MKHKIEQLKDKSLDDMFKRFKTYETSIDINTENNTKDKILNKNRDIINEMTSKKLEAKYISYLIDSFLGTKYK